MDWLVSVVGADMAKAIVLAVIASITAVVIFVLKDYLYQSAKDKKAEEKALLDKKMEQVYSPLYVYCVAGQRTLGTAIADPEILKRLIENYHLLSYELQTLFDSYLSLTRGDFSSTTVPVNRGTESIDITTQFTEQLRKEMEKLTALYK
ncbi:hypothetical protein P3467_24445 [Vibrio parahaemolyticus]|uniref:hypothetical protein n=1 Tax=Vibrio parahaemolyticus TaxID=670 RepID=UPI0011204CDA|nr:hypothetical protein [Vibrio parahaemolyticus]MDF4499896.1 hypothetical protein [Vibrio parahaemolyticus]MDG3379982.1 hypothetical protein [Vibrio parahaemolyticus]TOA54814.1 hypothetical protein CGK23_23330 [Vibrio parahaemolyticus]